jgi:hypothetical protein
MLLGTALVLALTGPASAQTAPTRAVVQTDGAEVRCRPGAEAAVYVTQKLRRGDTVQVVEKVANDWLKIEPPQGSFSWVNSRAVRPAGTQPNVWVVLSNDAQVPVLVGSPFKPGKPDVIGTSLARGAQVVVIGAHWPSGDGDWLPIAPPPGEYRYIRAADLAPPAAATTVARPDAPAAGAGSSGPPLAPVAIPDPAPRKPDQDVHVGAAPATSGEPLLDQAQQRERTGDRLGAAAIYDQLGRKYFASDHDAAVQYFNRAAWLRGGSAAATAPPVNQANALFQQATQYEKAGNWTEAIRTWERLGDLCRDDYQLSMQYYNRAGWLRQRHPTTSPAPSAPPATTSSAPPPASAAPGKVVSGQKSELGLLQRSPTFIDGQPTYVLETSAAQVIAYLRPQAGVNLEAYVGKNVEVIGQVVPRNDLRDRYMIATLVRPLSTP